MSARARWRLARSRYSRVANVTMPASKPMITTTIITSMREKPRSGPTAEAVGFLFTSYNRIARLQDGENGREDDQQHETSEQQDQQWLEQRGEALRLRGHLLVVRDREPVEHVLEPPGRLADREELHDGGREGAGAAQRVGDVLAGDDGALEARQRVAQDEVGGRALRDLHRADEDDAALQERAEDHREAHDGLLQNQITDDRDVEDEAVPREPAARRADEDREAASGG